MNIIGLYRDNVEVVLHPTDIRKFKSEFSVEGIPESRVGLSFNYDGSLMTLEPKADSISGDYDLSSVEVSRLCDWAYSRVVKARDRYTDL